MRLCEPRFAAAADSLRVGETIASAFEADPLTDWFVPVRADRSMLPRYFGAFASQAVAAGRVYIVDDFDAVAVWFDATTPSPPPAEPDPEIVTICGPYLENYRILGELMHQAHPATPAHHHLAFLAVRPHLQRHGVGSRLLGRHHGALDDAGLGSYVDASNPESRRLYLRHGYRDLDEPFHPPGGPPIWPMWRPPGGRAG